MKKRNGYAAILLGLLVGAGGTAFAQSTNLAVTADATVRWEGSSYIVKGGTADDVDYPGQEKSIALRHEGPAVYQHTWGLFTFDAPAIPENMIITNATLNIVVRLQNSSWPAAANFPKIGLFNNLGAWSEAGGMDAPLRERVPVETEDTFYDWQGNPAYPFTGENTITNGSAGWFHISSQGLLDLVQGWYDGSITNFGLSVEATGTNYTDTLRYFLLNTKEMGWGAPYIAVDYMPAPPEATQTMALGASDDATVAFYNPAADENFGSDPKMDLRHDSVIVGSLATFDLSPLAGLPIEVTGAKIRFYVDLPDSIWEVPSSFSPVAIYKNTSAWDEASVTGSSAPTFDGAAIATADQFVATVGTNTLPFTGTNTLNKYDGGWLEFGGSNTLALVKGWINGTIPNNGVAISTTVANDSFKLFWMQTKEALAAGAHPQLILEFLGGLTYDEWAADWGVDLSDREADYEGDGLVNLLEYAFGGNPTNDDKAVVSPTLAVGADVVHVYNSRAVSELSYELYVDQDNNLITYGWTNAAAMGAVVTVGPAADPKFNSVTNTFSGGGGLDQAFLKLEVSD